MNPNRFTHNHYANPLGTQNAAFKAGLRTKHEQTDERLRIDGALEGLYGVDQQRIAEVGIGWLDLMLRKNADYGSAVWEVPVLAPTTDAKTAILVRMSDKVSRIRNLLNAEQQVKGESLEDTLRDLGAYCLLYLAAPMSPQ